MSSSNLGPLLPCRRRPRAPNQKEASKICALGDRRGPHPAMFLALADGSGFLQHWISPPHRSDHELLFLHHQHRSALQTQTTDSEFWELRVVHLFHGAVQNPRGRVVPMHVTAEQRTIIREGYNDLLKVGPAPPLWSPANGSTE
jgi:hypothetical protein